MARIKSETRQLTEGVFVRFSPADLDEIRREAGRLNVSVAQLVRDTMLGNVCPASLRAS
ncbi:hypothetical protein ACQ86B_28830 (plasmid) [Mycolicibacterium aichiense]|uniref:hypothetical protein n=1 Tax=Mycolicibacterium aichiense TaxID=1799 RepID=UPI003D66C885